MEDIGSLSDLNDQEVLLINDQLIENAAITVQLSSFEGEPHLGSPQPTPQTTEAVIVTGGIRPVQVQQPAAVAVDQNLQFTGDNTAVVYDVEVQPAAVTVDQNLQFPGNDTAVVFDVEAQPTLVPNRSDPIERLRFIAASTLFYTTMVGVLFLPRDIHGVHTTYGRVKLIASVGIPIVFSAFSLFVSFWLASDPVRWSNWIKGLWMVNVSMLSGPLAFYWALAYMENGKIRGQGSC